MAGSRYYRVGPGVWNQNWDDEARLLAFYLLTCEHRTVEGLFRLPAAYIAEDTGWSLDRIEAAFRTLERDGFVERDSASKMVLVVNALRFQKPANANGVHAAISKLRDLPSTPLLGRLLAIATVECEPLATAILNAFPHVENNGCPPVEAIRAGAGVGAGAGEEEQPQGSEPSSPREVVEEPQAVVASARVSPQTRFLCDLLADLIRARDPRARVAPSSERWTTAMRLLISDRDDDVVEVERVLRWSQRDSFWQSNILSPTKLREKFETLRAHSLRRAGSTDGDGLTQQGRMLRDLRLAEEAIS